ncbi:MAG: hypothetical protein K6G25_06990 [Bacteroidales bacterium]|nr:hypothetical protein [Bacteroidales bacterium]
MRKNLLKNMILALLLTAAVPTLTAQVHVGDILCEGNAIISPANYPSSGATAIGVVFYVDNTGQHGWAVALEDEGSYQWGCNSFDMPLPNYSDKRQAIYDLDGYENTRIMRENCTSSPAFYAVDFENGWYVPAIGQLNLLYGNLVEVNASLIVAGGTVFSNSWEYWSSTEGWHLGAWRLTSSGDLYPCDYNSYHGILGKDDSRSVRAARNF